MVHETVAGSEEQRTEVFFHPSPWLLRRGYTLLSEHSYGYWQHTFHSYNVIPWDHPVFDACKAGNIELVQQMCSKGQVTPFDMSPSRRSLLHVRS